MQRLNDVNAHMKAFASLHCDEEPEIELHDFGKYQTGKIIRFKKPSVFLTKNCNELIIKAKSSDPVENVFISKKLALKSPLIGVVSHMNILGKISDQLAAAMAIAKIRFPEGSHIGLPVAHWPYDHGVKGRRWLVERKSLQMVFYAFEENNQPMFATYFRFNIDVLHFNKRNYDDIPKAISMNDERLRLIKASQRFKYIGPDPYAALDSISSNEKSV